MSGLSQIAIERQGDVIFATLAGEIDPSNARSLASDLNDAVPNDAMAVVLDLADVRYLDSSGVQLLFELAERLAARQQRLAVAVPPDAPARRVLEIVALDVTAPVANSREEALERLGL
jgi:stage II sporulation protein AA (anti-sigma F factor antagonist)